MFTNIVKAMNDKAQMIHEIACGTYVDQSKVIPFTVVCKDCKQEVELDDTEHRCLVKEI